ncbi:carbamoyltransferase HypF [Pseudescherichia sp.]|uniref:carbamoyltransferase HypF n=1 Tax=Pseudescherichia sp. TaxID=2055881 RepID=UPI0028A1FB93|nr:carbamoyltransferase HypF [Pseudescherichia sp.]
MVPNYHDSAEQSNARETRRYRICGIVQGVGFRPFVHRLARTFDATGWVLNDSEGVLLELQATPVNISCIMDELVLSPPPLARISSIKEVEAEDPGQCYEAFTIRKSRQLTNMDTIIPPDSNVCQDCLNEMRDPNNSRYRYAFINCTNCGPRYSIIKAMPYDRTQTTMRIFAMCPACQREYNDIESRRYHAQPNACSVCGPKLQLVSQKGTPINTHDIVRFAIAKLREGAILAIKSLGGFHLVVDGNNENAVKMLRIRKRRDAKPFAVMVADIEQALRIADISLHEKALLESVERPIVLLRKRQPGLPEAIAPHNPNIGIMLPSTPLQYLMLEDPSLSALVMTSGNISGHPIVFNNAQALEQLGGIADYFILNDRDIHTRIDDSVVRVMAHRDTEKCTHLYLRRSRGYAPYPIHLAYDVGTIVALGAELKTTVSIAKGNKVFMSQHIGDLKNDLTATSHIDCINHLQKLLGIEASTLACDLHPAFRSTRSAMNQSQRRVIQVQHHHAHMASCMADNGLSGKTIGVIFDGTGYGIDGTIWGGEFLIGDTRSVDRAAHLRHIALPGGDNAIKEPVRVAISLLTEIYGESLPEYPLPGLRSLSFEQRAIYAKMAARKFNAPVTSSMGRLFDGVSALMGVCTHIEYEAQAAIELEALLQRDLKMGQPFSVDIVERNGCYEIDYRPMINELVLALMSVRSDLAELSRRFHSTIVETITAVCMQLSTRSNTRQIVLSGGVFCNEFLLINAMERLNAAGLDPYCHQRVPTNDGGISLGQVVVASSLVGTYDTHNKEIAHV